jgi:hypothetical protein
MKLLFLDHYGVMCLGKPGIIRSETSQPTADEFADTGITVFSDFDSDAVSILNSLWDSIGFEIVISSDWKRHTTLDGMCAFYQRQGIKKMPRAYTDWLPGHTTYHKQRATEINTWLDQHPEITHWAAVDDLYMGSWLTNFVWAKNIHLGIKDKTVQKQIIELMGS